MSYTLIQQFNPQHAHIKFNGQFQGKTVTWDTHLLTLQEYVNQENNKNVTLRQFIDIEPINSDIMKLTVTLNVPKVDRPTIHKTMIMINQYKKLSLGRHEYGERIHFTKNKVD